MNIVFKINGSKFDSLKNFIERNDDLFTPKLSQQINLAEYIKKIYSKAKIFEAYYKNYLCAIIALYENQNTKEAFITLVLCDKEYLRRGIISKLYQHSEIYLKKQNIKAITLETQKTNTISQNLYKKLGFIKQTEENSKIIFKKVLV